MTKSENGSFRPKAIILWCHPRSTSTMFERAFLQRKDTFTVLHEHMGDPWYFGPERAQKRFSAKELQQNYPQHQNLRIKQHWDDILNIANAPDTPPRVFVKDMAQYIQLPTSPAPTALPVNLQNDSNPTFIDTESLLDPDIVHTFLIRNPEKSVPSYYKLTGPDAKTDFTYFDKDEIGLAEVRNLYDFISEKQKQKQKQNGTGNETDDAKTNGSGINGNSHQGPNLPILIDSDDLIKNPVEYISKYCEYVGVDFDSDMVNWSSGEQSHFQKWKGWHEDVEKSTGIGRVDNNDPTTPPKSKPVSEQPEIVQEGIQENMDHYNYLKQYTLKL